MIPDPRRGQGRRHPLSVVFGIAAGASLCTTLSPIGPIPWGSKPANVLAAGVKTDAIRVPSEFVIRDCIVRIEPGTLDRALHTWNQA